MSSFRFLASIRDCESIICQKCRRVQYPRNGRCVACNSALKLDFVSLRIDALQAPDSGISKDHVAQVTGTLLRSLRKRRGICQSQLVRQAAGSITRTSLSKAECGRMLLPLYKLLPLARALGLTEVILRFEDPAAHAAHQSTNRH